MRNRKIIVFFILFFSLSFLFSEEAKCNCNCFSIIVGKKASEKGIVLVAHNEDDALQNSYVNIRKIKSFNDDKNITIITKNGKAVKINGKRQEILWFQIPNLLFADGFVNKNGVIIVSNACSSKEKDKNGNKLSYLLRRLVAERARTAREGVKLMGELVEKYGYDSSGRTYTIADKNEGWFVEIVRGNHWIAQRVDDDKVSVIPNHYIIHKINLKNSDRFLGSKDIISYAVKKGWYNPKKDGSFDFAKVYSKSLTNKGNIYRHWRGLSLLTGKKYSPKDILPFQVKPKNKITVKNLMAVLRDHYEGTIYDITNNYDKGNPNSDNKYRPICVRSTQYSIVTELRDKLPLPISTLLWVSIRKPDTSVYFPFYYGVSSIPKELGFGKDKLTYKEILSEQFGKNIPFNKKLLYFKIVNLEKKINKNYKENIKDVIKARKDYEDYYMKIIPFFENSYLKLYKKDKIAAQIYLDNFFYGGVYGLRRVFNSMDEKLK